MKKSCATNFSQYCWPEIGGKCGDIWDLLRFEMKEISQNA